MQNPFQNPGFSMASLTAAINLIPNRYGRLEELNLFPAKPVRTRSVVIESRNGTLNLLPSLPVGSAATQNKHAKRQLHSFVIPHIPLEDVVLPEEVQGVRAFGSETEMDTVAQVLAQHLESMRNKHAITLEHLRMGALKGVILDADGSVLHDLFEVFKLNPSTVNFQLNADTTNVRNKCADVVRGITENLRGEFMTGVRVLCSPSFFAKLTGHAKVEKAYENYAQGAMLRDDVRNGFAFGGIVFEEYLGKASYIDGAGAAQTRDFIAEGEAHAFPLGTVDTFATYFAPADFNETVNTLGQAIYAKQEPRKFDRGTDLHTQSNPLPMCHRPGVLVKLTMA
jgi:hypothetical protein